LAAIRQRLVKLGADRLIYVVGSPQSQHLEMVFATARAAGWLAPPKRAQHMAFGSVLGPDKKMFKTRSGETVKLEPLLDEAAEHAAKLVRANNPDLDVAESAAIARAVGVGAVKYADLANDRIRDYVFDWSRMLSLDGNTAPYLLYAHVRARSIARKSATAAGAIRVEEPAEHVLALDLLRFGAVLTDVAESLEPHRLCGYLYDLAGAFTTFYEQCPVLKAEDAATRASRLALAEHTADVLRSGLGLLGIEAPDRM
jgi:arginyl-tRNA synthetase